LILKRVLSKEKNICFSFNQLLILLSMSLVVLFIVIASTQSFYSAQKHIMSKIENTHADNVQQAAHKINSELQQIENIVRYLATNDLLIEKIQQYANSKKITERLNAKEDIYALLARMKHYSEYISSIVIFTSEESFYSGYGSPFYRITHNEILDSILGTAFNRSAPGDIILFKPTEPYSLNPDINLYTLTDNYSFGTLIIDKGVEYGSIFAIIKPCVFNISSEHNSSLILGSEGEVIWCDETINDEIIKIVKDAKLSYWQKNIQYTQNKKFALYQTELGYNNWKLYYIQANSEINNIMKPLKNLILLSFIISVIFAIFLSRLMSKRIAEPVQNLTESVNSYDFKLKKVSVKYKEKKYRFSLRESIIYYLISVVFIPVCFYMAVSHIATHQIIRNYIIESHFRSFKQIVENIDFYIQTKEKIGKSIAYSEIIQNFLDDSASTYNSDNKPSIYQVDSIVDKMIQLSPGKDDVYIYDQYKNLKYNNTYFRHQPDIGTAIPETLQQNNTNLTWSDSRIDQYKRPTLCLNLKINHVSDYNTIGYLHYEISEDSIENIYTHSTSSSNILYIINDDNKIISHYDKDKIGTFTETTIPDNVEKHLDVSLNALYFKLPLINSSWYLVGQFPLSIIQSDQQAMLYEKFYMLIFIFFLTILVAYVVSYHLIASINKINMMLKNVGIDNMEIEFPEDSLIHEINELGGTFNNMVNRLYALVDQLIISTKKQHELANRKKEAELAALQAQINPHFLYNTFESVNWLIKSNELDKATVMLNSLSEFLRYTAKSNEPIVTIKEELGYAKHYALIMQMRFGPNLKFIWDIDEALMDQKTIRLILQPLIENAIYHGIQPKGKAGIIKITCYRSETDIILQVSDNGIGMSQEEIEEKNRNLNDDTFYESIGLYNVQNRIKLFFGHDYGITLYGGIDQGLTVDIKIPFAE
jgi:two-component system sensor histidine kinase YesM